MTPHPDVLVAGAGPAGLTLALQAHDHGARVRIVEQRPEAFRPSRALIVHPRTLEVLRPIGVVDALLARADIAPAARLHLGSRVVTAQLGGLDLPDTPYPHLSLLRQMDVEAVLAGALAERGVPVQRGTALVGLGEAHGGGARVTLNSAFGVEETTCRTVAACDGAGSTARTLAGIGWRGATLPPGGRARRHRAARGPRARPGPCRRRPGRAPFRFRGRGAGDLADAGDPSRRRSSRLRSASPAHPSPSTSCRICSTPPAWTPGSPTLGGPAGCVSSTGSPTGTGMDLCTSWATPPTPTPRPAARA